MLASPPCSYMVTPSCSAHTASSSSFSPSREARVPPNLAHTASCLGPRPPSIPHSSSRSLTNDKKLIGLLINEKRLLRLLTNERRVLLRILAYEKRVLRLLTMRCDRIVLRLLTNERLVLRVLPDLAWPQTQTLGGGDGGHLDPMTSPQLSSNKITGGHMSAPLLSHSQVMLIRAN